MSHLNLSQVEDPRSNLQKMRRVWLRRVLAKSGRNVSPSMPAESMRRIIEDEGIDFMGILNDVAANPPKAPPVREEGPVSEHDGPDFQPPPVLEDQKMGALFKLAKERGLKPRFGLKKPQLIDMIRRSEP